MAETGVEGPADVMYGELASTSVWPRPSHDPEDDDLESLVARRLEERLARAVGDRRVLFARGGAFTVSEDTVRAEAAVYAEGLVVRDSVQATPQNPGQLSATEVVSWADLRGVTIEGVAARGRGDAVRFKLHFAGQQEPDVIDSRKGGKEQASKLLDYALGVLARRVG